MKRKEEERNVREADREQKIKDLELRKLQLERYGELAGLQVEMNALEHEDVQGLQITQGSVSRHEETLLDLSITEMVNWGDAVYKQTCKYKVSPKQEDHDMLDYHSEMHNTCVSSRLPLRSPEPPEGVPGETSIICADENHVNNVVRAVGPPPLNTGAKTVTFNTTTFETLGTFRGSPVDRNTKRNDRVPVGSTPSQIGQVTIPHRILDAWSADSIQYPGNSSHKFIHSNENCLPGRHNRSSDHPPNNNSAKNFLSLKIF